MDLDAYLALVLFAGITDGIGMDFSVFQFQPVGDFFHIFDRYVFIQPYVVNLFLLERRMRQLGSQIAVVGKQEYACGISIQTSYRINAFRAGILHQIHYGKAFLRIVGRSYAILWLIQYDIDLAFDLYRLVVEEHLVLARNLRTQFRYDLIVYFHHAGLDKFVGFTTRANSGIRQEFVQTDRFVGIGQYFLILQLFLEAVLSVGVVIALPTVVVRTAVVVVTARTVVTIRRATSPVIAVIVRVVHPRISYARSSFLDDAVGCVRIGGRWRIGARRTFVVRRTRRTVVRALVATPVRRAVTVGRTVAAVAAPVATAIAVVRTVIATFPVVVVGTRPARTIAVRRAVAIRLLTVAVRRLTVAIGLRTVAIRGAAFSIRAIASPVVPGRAVVRSAFIVVTLRSVVTLIVRSLFTLLVCVFPSDTWYHLSWTRLRFISFFCAHLL